MPDYASILRRSISALPDPTPEMREAVYQRARAALARQLTAVDPPLSNREIESQHQELENAVQRLEADYAPPEPEPEPYEEEPAEEPVYYAAPQSRTAYAPPQQHEARAADEEEEAEEAPEDEFEAGAEEEYEEDEERRPSRLPALVALGALVLAVVGLGAYGYAKRDAIFGLFGGGENVSVVSTTATPVVPAPEPSSDLAATEDPDKVEDRLTNGGTPAPEEETALAVPETPPPAPLTEDPATPTPAEATPPAEEQTAALPPPDEELVAQRAIFYLQGAEGSPARAVEGSVIWTETTRENSPAVQAILRLPDPAVTATVTIYRNLDVNLPWSHMVEIEFEGTLSTRAIQTIPALVLKPDEGHRGEPLAGTDEKVTDDLFWIALSDDAEEMARNTTLLREGAWFDIPILFDDESRALLTFEKGVPGDRVFETVMAAWTSA